MKTYSESSTKDPESLLGSTYSHIDGTEQDSLSDAPSIEELLRRNADLWLGCDIAGQGMHGRTTGYPQLDDILPGRGWPQNGLLEIINPQ